ncbi:MAG: STAS domain-containing protein [Caldiserica bacterium]|nr:STAS domain-containing protein [Caldisericota bacterium]
MEESRLTYQEYKGKIVIKVYGKGTWVEGKTFLDFCEKKFKEGKEIYVDLKDCHIIDSTFLGIIASLVLKKRPLYLFHMESPHVLRSIKTLGLSKILPGGSRPELPREVKEWEIPLQVVKGREEKDLIAQAHRTLVEAVPENIEKFKDVLELLENEEEKSIRRIPWRRRK